MRDGSLPQRVLAHLLAGGPDYGCRIAAALDARAPAVAAVLTDLRDRGLVHVARAEPNERGRGRPRLFYAATANGADALTTTTPARAPTATPPRDEPRPLPSPIGDALGSELARLRAHADDADPEIVALVYGNSALPGA
jgi:DNA-binding PadR family transcriptional regulator